MKIHNVKSWAPTGASRWVDTLAIFLLALFTRMSLQPLLDAHFPLLAFSIATLYIHYRYGLAPAIVTAIAAFPAAIYFFIPPYGEFDIAAPEDVQTAIAYGLLIAAFMFTIQRLRRAQYRAELLADVAESRYLMLLQSEDDRQAVERDLKERGSP
ncbi:MAG TPA: DUF4118 domain-containing protein [Burkholderiales bacterium]|nr:DUF4118 domain-containing protein [Burkholderiales bacterium]